ncbi:MAG: flippase [Cyanobacteria bacterium P01_G01_bin.49]
MKKIFSFWPPQKLSSISQKVIKNTSWLVAQRALKILIGFAISVWLARYLGPQNFGIYNYSIAYVAIFGSFSSLGLKGIIVREIVHEPHNEDEILGTTFILRLMGGFLGLSMTLLVGFFLSPEAPLVRLLILIISFNLLFKSIDFIDFYFQSKIKSKYTVYANSFALVLGAFLKILLIKFNVSLIYFALVLVLENILLSISTLILYQKMSHRLGSWKINLHRAKHLLTQSWPLVLSQIGVVIYFKIDQIMLAKITNPEIVGIYSVAAKVSESGYFIPSFIMASVFPILLSAKQKSLEEYNKRFQDLYILMAILATFFIIPGTFLANPLILAMYGSEFKGASEIFIVHIWSSFFIFQGAVLSKWLISEGILKFSFVRHWLGATVNILLNLILIPQYGAMGAAIATVIAYALASYFVCFLKAETRMAGIMMTRAMGYPIFWVLRRFHQEK